ncbi:aminoglycoside phosphotransferase family protein [Natronospora cellulosivora (SeqCode)]
MIQISLNEIKSRAKSIVGSVDSIKAIGNHHLKRHLVYKLKCANKNYVLKLYHKKNRWNREVACLKFFADSNILAPEILDYGIFDDGIEWLVYEFIEGKILLDLLDRISLENWNEIYYEMGKQLGLIHGYKNFNFFGSMDEEGNSINNFSKYRDYFEQRINKVLVDLHTFKHDEPLLIRAAEAKLKSMYKIVDGVNEANLCHNDYDQRNIIAVGYNGKYHLTAVIDFEQCVPDDIDKELIYVYLPLLANNQHWAENFIAGYEEYGEINLERLYFKKDFYNLYKGIIICAWAKKVDYDYYLKGLEIIKGIVKI